MDNSSFLVLPISEIGRPIGTFLIYTFNKPAVLFTPSKVDKKFYNYKSDYPKTNCKLKSIVCVNTSNQKILKFHRYRGRIPEEPKPVRICRKVLFFFFTFLVSGIEGPRSGSGPDLPEGSGSDSTGLHDTAPLAKSLSSRVTFKFKLPLVTSRAPARGVRLGLGRLGRP